MPTVRSYSLLIGARNSRRTFSRRDEQRIQQITLRHFPTGCSILNVSGVWFDPATGRFRKEEARQIILATSSTRSLDACARELGRFMSQKELILVEHGKSRTIRISPP